MMIFAGGFGEQLTRQLCKPASTLRWSWGCVSAIDSNGRAIFVAAAHRDDGKRFVVHADEKLTAFLELERVTRESSRFPK